MGDGKTVRLFLANGTYGGLLTAEVMNWTGHLVAAPRSALAAPLRRPEAARTGIYLLLGEDPDSGGVLAYIGEGDDVGKRIQRHSVPEPKNGKDFWDRVILITSKDANLTKAHARYLEAQFIQLALEVGRAKLTNNTVPPIPSLPEADMSDMDNFILETKSVLPVLGVNVFRSVSAPSQSTSIAKDPAGDQISPVFEMVIRKHGISATGQEVDGEFTVRAGSQARATWIGGEGGYQRLREELESDAVVKVTGDGRVAVFTRDHVFASPSAAAAIVTGRSANGRVEWKIQGTNTTFGEWQNRGIDSLGSDQTP